MVAQSNAYKEWAKIKTVVITMRLQRSTDADILAYLEGKQKQTEIKKALRYYISAQAEERKNDMTTYEELASKALSADATQTDIDNLGKWFEREGTQFWNGECYTIDSNHDLYPVYREVAEDEFEITGYEIR